MSAVALASSLSGTDSGALTTSTDTLSVTAAHLAISTNSARTTTSYTSCALSTSALLAGRLSVCLSLNRISSKSCGQISVKCSGSIASLRDWSDVIKSRASTPTWVGVLEQVPLYAHHFTYRATVFGMISHQWAG